MSGRPPLTRAGRFWAFVPVALIVAMLGGLGTMTYLAADDPSFAVEKDYYKKAIAWDDARAQAETNARLGWKVVLSAEPRDRDLEVLVKVADGRGAPVRGASVSLEAFANARAAQIQTTTLRPDAEGSYRGSVPLTQAGLWEFRLRVEARGQVFTHVLRQQVRTGGPS